jgi:choline kinase
MGGKDPKALAEVHDQGTLMHYSLRALSTSGVQDLMVVTGFASRQIQSYVDEHWTGTEPTYLFNARYASWGNFHSVRLALDASPGVDVLVLNCDVVVPPSVIARVLRAPGDLVLAVQRRSGLDDEDMRVTLEGEAVRAIGKHLGRRAGHGEFCGVSVVRPPAARRYVAVATEREWRAATAAYYEDVYAEILDDLDARAVWVGEGEYAEVDEPGDLDAAAAVIVEHLDAWGSEAVAGRAPDRGGP